MRRTETK